MRLLIDGYNLLHVSGIFAPRGGPASLERSRNALLAWLAATLDGDEVAETTVVFDAREAIAGLPSSYTYRGLSILFASEHEDADALIEALIRAESAPRRLTVVSSDHRIQRAATRRKAVAIDSDVWHARMVERRRLKRAKARAAAPSEKQEAVGELELQAWLAAFDVNEIELGPEADAIFPPGYAEDVTDDDL